MDECTLVPGDKEFDDLLVHYIKWAEDIQPLNRIPLNGTQCGFYAQDFGLLCEPPI